MVMKMEPEVPFKHTLTSNYPLMDSCNLMPFNYLKIPTYNGDVLGQIPQHLERVYPKQELNQNYFAHHQQIQNHGHMFNNYQYPNQRNDVGYHMSDATVKCTFCGQLCGDEMQLKQHMQVHSHFYNTSGPYNYTTVDNSNTTAVVNNNMQNSSNEPTVSCKQCNTVCASNTALEAHMERQHSSNTHQCPHCTASFARKLDLYKHKLHNHADLKTHVCIQCNKSFWKKENLTRHKQTHLKGLETALQVRCPHCDFVPVNAADFEQHLKNLHNIDVVQCSVCHCRCSNQSELEDHMLRHNDTVKQEKCIHCNRMFWSPYGLRLHVLTNHSQDKSHKCDQCDRTFLQKRALTQHIRTRHSDKIHRCALCKQTFSLQQALNDHMGSVHMNQLAEQHFTPKNYASGEPQKPTTSASSSSTNTGQIDQFQCIHCQKVFNSKLGLSGHMKVHINERIYKCPLCEHAYASKYNLKRHSAVHSESPIQYECIWCHKMFTQKWNLDNHCRRIHKNGKDEIRCVHCNEVFGQQSDLDIHMQIHVTLI